MQQETQQKLRHNGFALVVTVSVLVLLAVIAIGLLSLSTVTVRTASKGSLQAEARANARLALVLAIGELQKEMGPDMRVSAESALLDEDAETEGMEGVDQSRWLASYDAWGNWLNAGYTPPGGERALNIQDTYTTGRKPMFRRWLLSLPEGTEGEIDAPRALAGLDDEESVVMVGAGSLGSLAEDDPSQVTRAYLNRVGERGKQAWWIGPENHKAKITLAKQTRNLSAEDWERSHGDAGEVGVGGLEGFEVLDDDASLSEKLISRATMEPAGVARVDAREQFFDLTAHSRGVLANVRSGGLKRDLSLLFDQTNPRLPSPYGFNANRAVQEPSIRPMSADLRAKNPAITNRHFASWTNMRHFYRMYRTDSDATIGEIGGSGSLKWDRGRPPYTDYVASTSLGRNVTAWDGSNNYWRVPILAKITFIYSLVAEPSSDERGKYDCYHVYSPVFTYWNPYSVEMRIPDNKVHFLTSAYKVLPNSGEFWLGNTLKKNADQLGAFGQFGYSQGVNVRSVLRSERGPEIVFKPGEFKVFSFKDQISNGGQAGNAGLYPGFDPRAIGGEKKHYGTFSPRERPGLAVQFSHNYWGGNINYGNTCGSLCMVSWWDRGNTPGAIPINYAIDWLQKDQRMTPITVPKLSSVARWSFSDSEPVPIAFTQLVIKGLSEFDYESIQWDRDWRSRNWIQSPPSYFGSGMYISEDDSIAHTQRLDSPYVLFFGPMSMSEMPKVVGHIGSRAFLGSGSSPYEKVTAVPALELPTAPISSLAGFSNMRINPGWVAADELAPHLSKNTYRGNAVQSFGAGESLYAAETKRVSYQSGVTGPGIGNSFLHPMIGSTDVYRYIDNSKSEDILDRSQPDKTTTNDTKAYCDYWDHTFLLNDALWDDYFVSSLADQDRPGASSDLSLEENLDRLFSGETLANSRYILHDDGGPEDEARDALKASDGFLKAAGHLMVDGFFNVNSTSVDAWYALFSGIRERQVVARRNDGSLEVVLVPSDKRIALSRFNTAVSGEEMEDPEFGVVREDGNDSWVGVRFLDDGQLLKLAEECVKQVKKRGPFLNYSEFINRRLSDDELGRLGALQSAIDYDDDSPEAGSINYRFKYRPEMMISESDLGNHLFETPEAAEGSRFAGIPGYVIQSDLLKPISNTLGVRDDTFRIRAYGEVLDGAGRVVARAWCEAIVQRTPAYLDSSNGMEEPARSMDRLGAFSDNPALTGMNRRFGRKFRVESFRWLNEGEI